MTQPRFFAFLSGPPLTGFQFHGRKHPGTLRYGHHGLREYSLNGWTIQERPNEPSEPWPWIAEAREPGRSATARHGFRAQEAAERFCLQHNPPTYPGSALEGDLTI